MSFEVLAVLAIHRWNSNMMTLRGDGSTCIHLYTYKITYKVNRNYLVKVLTNVQVMDSDCPSSLHVILVPLMDNKDAPLSNWMSTSTTGYTLPTIHWMVVLWPSYPGSGSVIILRSFGGTGGSKCVINMLSIHVCDLSLPTTILLYRFDCLLLSLDRD